jgi:hypothetical protein
VVLALFSFIDDKRTVDAPARQKVDAVEDELGRPARSDRQDT